MTHPFARRCRAFAVLAVAFLAFPWLAIGPACAARLTATVEPTFLGMSETIEFVISQPAGEGHVPPDLSPLDKDFDIIGRYRRAGTDKTTGERTNTEEWVMLLVPKRPGVLTVPAISLDGLTTDPVKVQVLPTLPLNQPEGLPTYVRLDVADAAPYAQSLVPVVVRIFDSRGMISYVLPPPTVDGTPLPEARKVQQYERTIGGQRYLVVERDYLLQPSKAGKLEIGRITAELQVVGRSNSPRSSLQGLFGGDPRALLAQTETITVSTRPAVIEVKPRPEGIDGWFLPATRVALTDKWSASPQKAQVGAILTRTIRLKAQGATAVQLPPLPLVEVDGVRQYLEADHAQEAPFDGLQGAELEKTISIIPTRPGRVTLPAIEVGWWNRRTSTQEKVMVPAVTLDVAPAPNAALAAPSPSAPPSLARPAPPPEPAPPSDAEASGARLRAALAWLAAYARPIAMGGAGILLLGIAVWLLGRRAKARRARARVAPAESRLFPANGARPASSPTLVPKSAIAAEQALIKACRTDDASAAHKALIAWMRISGLRAGDFRTPAMAAAVSELQDGLYGAAATRWKGRALLAAFRSEQRARQRGARRAKASRLAPLYPRSY